jgi:hypothetical protein
MKTEFFRRKMGRAEKAKRVGNIINVTKNHVPGKKIMRKVKLSAKEMVKEECERTVVQIEQCKETRSQNNDKENKNWHEGLLLVRNKKGRYECEVKKENE